MRADSAVKPWTQHRAVLGGKTRLSDPPHVKITAETPESHVLPKYQDTFWFKVISPQDNCTRGFPASLDDVERFALQLLGMVALQRKRLLTTE